MRRPIFAEAYRVVGKDVEYGQFHQCGKPDRWPHIVAEREERRTERAQFREHEPIDDGAHGVFAHAKMHDASAGRVGLKRLRARERGLGRRRQIARAAN